jgi:hypothetical protein
LYGDNIPEDQCSICGHLPVATRDAHRLTISELPVKEPVCDRCWEALAENCGWFQSALKEETKR